jgi:signal transduction histidine kinase/CheY-like chemotaxis protein
LLCYSPHNPLRSLFPDYDLEITSRSFEAALEDMKNPKPQLANTNRSKTNARIEALAAKVLDRYSLATSEKLSASPMRWLIAPALVAITVLIRLAWSHWIIETPFILMVIPVFLTSMALGFGQGIYATIVTTIATDYFNMLPRYTFKFGTPDDRARLGLFVLECILINFFAAAYRQSHRRLQSGVAGVERASQAKTDYLTNISHEIRTPLGAIVGFADLLNSPTLTEEERRHYAEIILRNGHQLGELLNAVLDLSKIEAGKLQIEKAPVSIRDIVAEVSNLMRIRAEAKGLQLRVHMPGPEIPAKICSDPLRLRQILLNLIGNAIKFTPSGSVSLSCEVLDHHPNGEITIGIRISDTGIGIASDKQSRIFNPFEQAESSTSRQFGGTGLGLPLSKKLAQALGGDLTLVKSAPGEGTTLLATFRGKPLQAVAKEQTPTTEKASASTSSPEPGRDLEGLKILLAEDSPDNQLLIKRYLGAAGAQIKAVENGALAVTEALSTDYDLVLMDIQMPSVDGYTATRKLRAEHFRKPIVALTAHAFSGERERCMQAGCSDYLTKPVDRRRLIEVIKSLSPRAQGAGS